MPDTSSPIVPSVFGHENEHARAGRPARAVVEPAGAPKRGAMAGEAGDMRTIDWITRVDTPTGSTTTPLVTTGAPVMIEFRAISRIGA